MFRTWKRRIRYTRALVRHRRELKKLVDSHLFFLEHRSVTVWGGISETDEAGLRLAVERAGAFAGPIVEIGALFGWTTQLLASLKRPEQALIAVDNFCWNPFCLPAADQRVIAQRTLRYCLDHCQTQLFEGTAEEFYAGYQGPTPSMVFIDADHSYRATLADIRWAQSIGVPVIAGHDYQDLHPGVVQAVDECFPEAFRVVGSVWIADSSAAATPAAAA
ncbi:MAG: class I SAM-dependent methyltransferase [Pirellulales bacterium]|nr:class I SAM-dependent methyltransferase [Pirellulales bacterium]